ncbi:tripartite tricarboxylate transporter substrate binding protein [Verticiella sediminum]|uniref:Tripartite tricarboxylate transporter substrate binding protein n=1 Tax=Verticiella sediminum TaxID=1247510 RepID=A0A556A6C2_9BURK|nr:tripartite tricarboxylate transporter substrate binding protein [Verticiella sediminum]TSH88441.1 tripartite tricarboxylate transporter substrate binding protein [Verticiella sediminum]
MLLRKSPSSRSTLSRARRRALGALAVALVAAWAGPAGAEERYPSKPIHLVVGFPPGGSNDIVARVVAPALGEILGVSVVVENRAGANATIGTEYTARAAPDGYTITLGSASPLAISPHTYPRLPYDPLKDLAGITTVAATPEVLAINPGVPARTLPELVALAKTRDITLASAGNGGLPHLAIELLKSESGGRIVHIPYKGGGPGMTDAVGGHVDGIIMDLPVLHSMITQGKLRAIAVTNDHRAAMLPDVPTSAEGGLPSVLALNWFAVMAPAGTPKPIIDTLHAALVKAVNVPEVKARLGQLGIEPFTQSSPEAFDAFMRAESVRWGAVAKASGATADN